MASDVYARGYHQSAQQLEEKVTAAFKHLESQVDRGVLHGAQGFVPAVQAPSR
jgi:hypothetical protein